MSLIIPEKIEDISAKWFTKILGEKVIESTFRIKTNANEGTGFCSTMVRVEYETVDTISQSVIVKLPPLDGESREILLKDKLDQTEILSYQILIPELIKEIPELKKYFCDIVYSEFQESPSYNSVLVLKDLKPEGYYIVTTANDLKNHHFNQGFDFLIKLHVASKCLESRLNSCIVSAYSWFPKCYNRIKDQEFPSMYSFFPSGFPAIYKVLARNEELSVKILPNMRKVEENVRGIFRAIINAGQQFPCLIHGDLWTHNILVKDEDEHVLQDFPIKVIDWQMVGYTDPAFDLVIFLLFCLPLSNLTVDGVTEAAKKYYQEYTALIQKHGCVAERSTEEFLKFFLTYGLSFAFTIVMGSPPLQSEPESEPKFHKIFDIFVQVKVLEFMLSLVGK